MNQFGSALFKSDVFIAKEEKSEFARILQKLKKEFSNMLQKYNKWKETKVLVLCLFPKATTSMKVHANLLIFASKAVNPKTFYGQKFSICMVFLLNNHDITKLT